MLKKLLALTCLTLPLNVSAAIVSLDSSFGADTITRDTETGLDWLDVTVTAGLSFNAVSAEFGAGGDYEGYRYATTAELDQLITNFGYVAVNQNCDYGMTNCDIVSGDNPIVEHMIRTLGDTGDAYYDAINDDRDVGPGGAGWTAGWLADNPYPDDIIAYGGQGVIADSEFIHRHEGWSYYDTDDWIIPAHGSVGSGTGAALEYGSFLVTPSAVPIPAAAWLFGSALLGLGVVKRRKA